MLSSHRAFRCDLALRAATFLPATRQYKGRVGERASFLLLDSELNARAQQLGDHFTIFTLGKKACDAFGDFGTDVTHEFRCAVGIETNGRGNIY
jgi:hypothetical protein